MSSLILTFSAALAVGTLGGVIGYAGVTLLGRLSDRLFGERATEAAVTTAVDAAWYACVLNLIGHVVAGLLSAAGE